MSYHTTNGIAVLRFGIPCALVIRNSANKASSHHRARKIASPNAALPTCASCRTMEGDETCEPVLANPGDLRCHV